MCYNPAVYIRKQTPPRIKEFFTPMSHTTWRLLLSEVHDGPMNMAIDQAIMESVAESKMPPTLRFYAWKPACLSLGYTQPFTDINTARLTERQWNVVRRITGGRAILHTDELTYSVAVPETDPIVEGDIVASYRRLSQALLAGLNQLGANVNADKRADGHASHKGPVCFEVPSHYEITAGGKKLLGSAQVRKIGMVMQHGSLPLGGDITRICDVLEFSTEAERELAKERVAGRAATLEDAISRVATWTEAAEAMIAGFEQVFGLTFEPSPNLSQAEQARAEILRAEKYACSTWNERF